MPCRQTIQILNQPYQATGMMKKNLSQLLHPSHLSILHFREFEAVLQAELQKVFLHKLGQFHDTNSILVVKRYLNDRDPLAITRCQMKLSMHPTILSCPQPNRGNAAKEIDSQDSSATEDGPSVPTWTSSSKIHFKALAQSSGKAPSSPIQAASPSTPMLPSLQRVGLKLDRSSMNALEALNKAIDECAVTNELDQKEDLAERQRSRNFQKNIRPAIDILRVNSVAGSSYSMLGSAKGKDDGSSTSLVKSVSSLEPASPRPLWMDMVERRQEAW
jgi:hypothetical protein